MKVKVYVIDVEVPPRVKKWLLRAATGTLVLGTAGAALAANPLHVWTTGDVLEAADLNANFSALDARLTPVEAKVTALEAKEPFAGTYPAIVGLGGGITFCGSAPAQLNVSSAPPTFPSGGYSDAFGHALFTNGGAIATVLGDSSTSSCPSNICAGPLTFFLKSPKAQALTIRANLDNAGAVYVDGVRVSANPIAGASPITFNVPSGVFALSLMSCSTDGPSIGFRIYDQFLTDPQYGLTVDYDRAFHRGNH